MKSSPASNKPRLIQLLALQTGLSFARLREVPAWQGAFFTLSLATSTFIMMFAGSTILPATRILDDAILMGSIGFLLAMTSVFGLHLLIAEGFLWSAYSRRIDPLALLPIPSNWAFYLKVIDAMISDPMALFFTIPLLAAFASGAENPTFGFLAAGLILPSILAMISATRLLALKFAVTFLNPEKIRGLVRLGAYQALIITIFLGGWFIYDLFTLARISPMGLESSDLVLARIGIPIIRSYFAAPGFFHALPFAWPVLALSGSFISLLWIGIIVAFSWLSVMMMARIFSKLSMRPPVEGVHPTTSSEPTRLSWLLTLWLPVAPESLISLETDLAQVGGSFSEAILEGFLLLGSLILLQELAPELYARSFFDGARIFSMFLFLLLTTPAAIFSREGREITIRRLLPTDPSTMLLAKTPAVVLRNLILLVPTLTYLTIRFPPRSVEIFATTVGCLILISVTAAIAAVASGTISAAFESSDSALARQVAALAMCGTAVGPLGGLLFAPDSFKAITALLTSALMTLGLWQRAIARIRNLALPEKHQMPRTLLSDAAIAALLFVSLSTSLGLLLPAALRSLTEDEVLLLHTFILQLGVLRYGFGYLKIRSKMTGEAMRIGPLTRMSGLEVIRPMVLGITCAGAALLYGNFASQILDVTPEAASPLTRILREDNPSVILIIALFIIAGLMAPLAEEMLFRRYLFAGLYEATGRFAISATFSALFFALVHPPFGFPIIFMMGWITAWFLHRTGNLASSILFHGSFNTSQLLLVLILGGRS